MQVSVSNLDLFRYWQAEEDLDTNWLLRRLRGEEPQSELMAAGECFHKALETLPDAEHEFTSIESGGREFIFVCDCEMTPPKLKELRINGAYGELNVRGRVDGLDGTTVTDYKTTGQFDPERLLEGYQWRLYLDMLGADKFIWKVFVLSEDNGYYKVTQAHELSQYRYPGLHEDCLRLASQYVEFARTMEIDLAPRR